MVLPSTLEGKDVPAQFHRGRRVRLQPQGGGGGGGGEGWFSEQNMLKRVPGSRSFALWGVISPLQTRPHVWLLPRAEPVGVGTRIHSLIPCSATYQLCELVGNLGMPRMRH